MDAFQQCVEDLATIDRLIELPHGRDIAVHLFRELCPYIVLLDAMKARDPSGGIRQVVDFAEGIRIRLGLDHVRLTG
jgi:hypothetical protein